MASYLSPVFINGEINEVFNANEMNHISDDLASNLIYYAKLSLNNIFTGSLNAFVNINVLGSINGIGSDVFSLVEYLPNVIQTLTNISNENGVTVIEDDFQVDRMTSLGNINSNGSVVGHDLLAKTMLVDEVYCRRIKSESLELNMPLTPLVYIHVNGKTRAIMNSELVFVIFGVNDVSGTFDILPNCRMTFYDAKSKVIFSFINAESKMIYNQVVNVLGAYKLGISYKGVEI